MQAAVLQDDAKHAELAEENAGLREEVTRLKQQIRLLRKALFGPRSERLVETDDNQAQFESMLAELEALSAELEEQPELPEPPPRDKQKRQKKTRRSLAELAPPDLPVQEVLLDVPEEDRVCLETGEPLVKIDEDRSRKLAYKPGHYYWIEYIRPKYAAAGHPEQGITQMPMPPLAIPGGDFDESVLAAVAVDKCCYHLPLYRQEERLHHQGFDLGRQTLCRLYLRAAELMKPLYEVMKDWLLRGEVIFTDDTPVQMQLPGKGRTHTGRMWVYLGPDTAAPYRLFEFTRDRQKRRPREFLGDWRGYLHADAYAGYADLFERDGMYECACMMHVRRKFHEAEDGPPELRRDILMHIRHLYRYERFAALQAKAFREAGAPERADAIILRTRQEKIAPIIDRIFARCSQALAAGDILPRSAIAGAIGYLQGRGDALRTFLTRPDLSPDNGKSERAIRPLTIGRRNWQFVGNEKGGMATGILLSIIQSCRALGLDPFTYLTDVLKRIRSHPSDQLQDLLPHRWSPAT